MLVLIQETQPSHLKEINYIIDKPKNFKAAEDDQIATELWKEASRQILSLIVIHYQNK